MPMVDPYDGTNSYTYDAENRVTQVNSGSTLSNVYDANGRRVRKNVGSSFTEYSYGLNGSVQSEYNGSTWPTQYVYAGSRLIAEYTNSTTDFIFADHLGSTRLVTGMNQSVIDSIDYNPFGQLIAGGSSTTHLFTGKERDEGLLTDFGARYYRPLMGRFMTPDWDEDPYPVPHADFENPQSLNLYGYVQNNPLSRIDSDGHVTCDPDTYSTGPNGELIVHGGGCHLDPSDYLTLAYYMYQGLVRAQQDQAAQTRQALGQSFKTFDSALVGALGVGCDCDDKGKKDGDRESSSKESKPKRVTNSKHHPNSKSPEPNNVQELWDKSIADGEGRRWAKDADGTIHRFTAPSNGESHWSGSTAGSNPIRQDDIPIEIRRALN
jgi:RHS repeat-associated protein